MRMRRRHSRRPPFENRWTSGQKGWRWYRELESLGVADARLRLALHDASEPVEFPDPEIADGFIRDWLRYRDRKARSELVLGVVATALIVTAIAAASPAILRWF